MLFVCFVSLSAVASLIQGKHWMELLMDLVRWCQIGLQKHLVAETCFQLAMKFMGINSQKSLLQDGFGIPAEIVSDNDKQLQGKNIDMLFDTLNIRKNKSTPIYPQSNGQAEATNKTIALNLKKTLDEHKNRWCVQLHNTLWAYRTTRRSATGESPFLLTYGAEAVIPTKIIMPTTKTDAWEKNLTADMMLERLDDLEERRETALQIMENYQRTLAREYNKKVKFRNFFRRTVCAADDTAVSTGEEMGKIRTNLGGLLMHPWNAKYLKPYYP